MNRQEIWTLEVHALGDAPALDVVVAEDELERHFLAGVGRGEIDFAEASAADGPLDGVAVERASSGCELEPTAFARANRPVVMDAGLHGEFSGRIRVGGWRGARIEVGAVNDRFFNSFRGLFSGFCVHCLATPSATESSDRPILTTETRTAFFDRHIVDGSREVRQ